MSYTIWYGESPEEKRQKAAKKYGKMILCILMVGAIAFGALRLRSRLIPPAAAVAFSSLTENLKSGQRFSDAVAAFCQEIIDNAKEDPLGH